MKLHAFSGAQYRRNSFWAWKYVSRFIIFVDFVKMYEDKIYVNLPPLSGCHPHFRQFTSKQNLVRYHTPNELSAVIVQPMSKWEVVKRSSRNSVPLSLLSFELWMFDKEQPDKKHCSETPALKRLCIEYKTLFT